MAGAQAAPADWSRLPPELLEQCCAWIEREAGRRAALQTCATWARAILHAPRGPHLSLDLYRLAPFAPSARALERLWGPSSQAVAPQQEQQQAGGSKGAKLVLHYGSFQRFLAELRTAGVRLACVTDLEMEWLTVDALVPPSLHLALPNLRSVTQQDCELSPNTTTAQLDSECSGLQHLAVSIRAQTAALPAQLAQLPSLCALTSLTLDTSTSTTFLPSLSSQLTALELGSDFRQCIRQTQRPTANWAATLQLVAQCTRLRSLALPAATAEELRPVATALPRLRRLHLNYDFDDERDGGVEVELDGDAMVEVLLGLTQLTRLEWGNAFPYVMRHSHTDRPCSWSELTFDDVGVHQLLRLPLRSLTSPVTVWALHIDPVDSVADVQRFVSVLVGEGGPGVVWWRSEVLVRFSNWRTDPGIFVHGATPADTPAALLRALQPLLAGAAEVRVDNVKWDAEAVRALPQCCSILCVCEGKVPLVAAVEMARCLRQLNSVTYERVAIEPWAVAAYAVTEEGERRQAGEVQGRRVRVAVCQPRSQAADHWQRAQADMRALGLAWLDLGVCM